LNETQFSEPTAFELTRIRGFVKIQVLFFLASPLAGGGHFRLWSMLDTALLVLSIGITALALVMESVAGRRRIMQCAVGLYLVAVVDMALNISIAGILGWKFVGKMFLDF